MNHWHELEALYEAWAAAEVRERKYQLVVILLCVIVVKLVGALVFAYS